MRRTEYAHHISSRTRIFKPSYGPIEPGLGEKWPLESQGSETNEAKAPLDVVLVPQDLISLQKFWLRNEKVSFKIDYFLVKFIYSEKVTKFCEIFSLLCMYCSQK